MPFRAIQSDECITRPLGVGLALRAATCPDFLTATADTDFSELGL